MTSARRMQLTSLDAAYDFAEGPDIGSKMVSGGVHIFDAAAGRAPDSLDGVVAWLEERIASMPILSRRVKHVPLSLDYGYLESVESLDLRAHVGITQVAEPGWGAFHAALIDAAYLPFDRSRPMWDVHVLTGITGVDGFPADAVAVLHRIHHTISDGMSNANLAHLLFARTPLAADPEPPLSAPSSAAAVATGLARLPGSLFRYGAAAMRLRRAHADPPGLEGFDPAALRPRTRFNQPLLGRAAVARVRLSLAEAKSIGRRLDGVTLNDVLLATVSGAMRAYLAGRGELPERTLVVDVPKSLRAAEDSRGGNGVFLMALPLHTEVADPVARLRAVHAGAIAEKDRVAGARSRAMRELFAAVPALVMRGSIRPKATRAREPLPLSQPTAMSSTEVTNVPLGPADHYFGEAPIHDQFVVYQLRDGMCLRHVVTSLGERLTITVTADDVAMPDIEAYADLLRDSYAQLLAAADAQGPR